MKHPFRALGALLVCALLASLGIAYAQTAVPTVSASIALNWTAPTTDTTGAQLAGATAVTSYRVWVSTTTLANAALPPAPTATLTATSTTSTQTLSAPAGGTIYAVIEACNQYGCSPPSNQVSQVVPGPVPGVPTSVTIKITIT